MKLIFIRHGDTIEGKNDIILGHLPGTLSADGILYSNLIGKQLFNLFKPDLIISSDLNRAEETAKIINKKRKIEMLTSKLLRERHSGIAQGQKTSEILWDNYEKKSTPYKKHEGGESFLDVRKRAEKFYKSIKKNRNKTILIVTHSVFISMFFSHFFKWSIKNSLEKKLYNYISILDTETKHLELLKIDFQ